VNVPAARIVFSDDDRAAVLSMVDDVLRTGSLTLGPFTRELEEAFRTRHDAPYAVAVSSGTSALEIILRALGVEGRQVVVPTNTFFATAAAVLHAGGTPRFADVAPDTMALSADTVETALGDDTAGVILVHIGGLITPEVDAIRRLCDRRGIFLVEDAAHAHGSSLDGRPAGSFGVASAFSFYPTKVMTTGEGGMIVTAEERIRDDATIYRDQGKAGFLGGDHVRLGYAWRMSELHAAVGIVQLRRLDEFIKIRREVAAQYDEGLTRIEGVTSLVPPGSESNYYKYIAMLAPGVDRQQVKDTLRNEHGVSLSGEVYSSPLHHQPVFAGLHDGGLPVAEDVCSRHVCLPIHSDMTREETAHVVASIGAVLGRVATTNGLP
jgi:dTDP-4-amino-4,6-dideoxygalactose transaminase